MCCGTWLLERGDVARFGLDLFDHAQSSTVARFGPQVTGSDVQMDKANTPTPQGDVWSWVVIGLVFCAVTAALYGPFIWELTHSV
jgi:hypothetical protein